MGGDQKLGMNVRVEGVGTVSGPPTKGNAADPVEYDGGSRGPDPMEEIARQGDSEEGQKAPLEAGEQPAVQEEAPVDETNLEPDDEADKAIDEALANQGQADAREQPEGDAIDQSKLRTDPTPSEARKEQFDPSSTQNALSNSRQEGGIFVNRKARTAGLGKTDGDAAKDGGTVKPRPDLDRAAPKDKFEVTGFEVQYDLNGEAQTVRIRDFYDDVETAMAVFNDNTYLMPMPNQSVKRSVIINGAPIICKDEQTKLEYVDGKWRRP